MSDLFDDVRNEKGLKKLDKHESDLERVVNSALTNTLHKNLDNFDSFYKGFSDSYNTINQGKVVTLEGESGRDALRDIRESFERNLNERDMGLDKLKNNMKTFRKELKTFLNDNNLRYMPHYSDRIWTDTIFMKYARKLGLIETFYQKKI